MEIYFNLNERNVYENINKIINWFDWNNFEVSKPAKISHNYFFSWMKTDKNN